MTLSHSTPSMYLILTKFETKFQLIGYFFGTSGTIMIFWSKFCWKLICSGTDGYFVTFLAVLIVMEAQFLVAGKMINCQFLDLLQ
jgi:hypothetical protein